MLAVVVVRNRKTGDGFRYTVADAWLPIVIDWNKTLDPAGRFDAAMKAEGLFEFASAGTKIAPHGSRPASTDVLLNCATSWRAQSMTSSSSRY
jgi:hypothetical protein